MTLPVAVSTAANRLRVPCRVSSSSAHVASFRTHIFVDQDTTKARRNQAESIAAARPGRRPRSRRGPLTSGDEGSGKRSFLFVVEKGPAGRKKLPVKRKKLAVKGC